MFHGRDRENYCLVTILCAKPCAKTFICVKINVLQHDALGRLSKNGTLSCLYT